MKKISEANRDRGGAQSRCKSGGKSAQPSHYRFFGAAILIALTACLSPRAQAGDLDDCNSSAADKIEAGCTAIINNPERTPEDGLKALTNRARLYSNRAKFDAALADAAAALQLNAQSVPALLIRGYAYQRKNNLDAALADFDRAAEIDPKNLGPYLSRGNLRLL